MRQATSLNPHLCPDCAVPISECGWWHGLRPPEGAKTGIRQISEYAGKGSRERVAVDRVIVLECPRFTTKRQDNKQQPPTAADENYQNLANSVIVTAVKDYRKALAKWNEVEILKLYHFFMSDYFAAITEANPRFILKKVE